MADLKALIAELEAAEEGSRELSDKVLFAVGWSLYQLNEHCPQFLISPDGQKVPYKISKDFRIQGIPDPTRNLQDWRDHVLPPNTTWCAGWDHEIVGPYAYVGDARNVVYARTDILSANIACLKAREVGIALPQMPR